MGEAEVECSTGPRDVCSPARSRGPETTRKGWVMEKSPWIRRIALTGFAALLYYGYAAAWWMPRMISG